MDIRSLAFKAERLITNNSPVLLTAVGVAGTLTTAFLTGKASFKAANILRDEEKRRLINNDDEMVGRDIVDLTWKLYIPPAVMAVTTVTCIVLANRIGSRRAAAVAVAYTTLEKGFTEYKDKVAEKFGEKEATRVRDDLAQDRVRRYPPVNSEIIMTGMGDSLCLDSFSGRYFRSNMDKIQRAVNEINAQVIHTDEASVSDYYRLIGLEDTSVSDDLGWRQDKLLEIHTSATLIKVKEDEAEQPCMVVDFGTVPLRKSFGHP